MTLFAPHKEITHGHHPSYMVKHLGALLEGAGRSRNDASVMSQRVPRSLHHGRIHELHTQAGFSWMTRSPTPPQSHQYEQHGSRCGVPLCPRVHL
jgi:hypothetical protein